MLREFRVDNFKSLINVVFQPQNANLLTGRNNSGKTNLCQALRFVSGSSAFELDKVADTVAGMRFGMTSFALDKSAIDFYVRAEIPRDGGGERLTFEYELTVSPPRAGTGETTVRLDHEVLRVDGGVFNDTVLLENVAGQGRLLHEKNPANGAPAGDGRPPAALPPATPASAPRYVETTAPTNATMLQRLFDVEANPTANQFKRYLTGWTYYDLSPAAMRTPLHKLGQSVVDPDGGNLASVLFGLKNANEREYRKLMEVVRHVEPGFDVINFFGGENNVFMFFEDRDGHSLPAANASSGTLRFLALAYVLLAQPKTGPSPLCVIEEPENGLHVGVLKTLFDMAAPPPDGPQIVFSSHAPYFIDLFDDHLDGIFLFDRDKGHTSVTQPDAARVKARLEEFPLGEQHFRDLLR